MVFWLKKKEEEGKEKKKKKSLMEARDSCKSACFQKAKDEGIKGIMGAQVGQEIRGSMGSGGCRNICEPREARRIRRAKRFAGSSGAV